MKEPSKPSVLIINLAAAQFFDGAAFGLCIHAPLFCCARWPRRPAVLRAFTGLLKQFNQSQSGVFPISLLGPEPGGREDEDPILSQTLAGEALGPRADIGGKRGRIANVKTQLDRGGDFIDVLTTGARRTDKGFFDLLGVEVDPLGNLNHRHSLEQT